MGDTIRVRALITGRVQGVWYRASTREEAVRLGLSGWVRNLPNGSVEAVFEGDRTRVDSAVEWCRQGPPHAIIENVVTRQETPEGLVGFEIIG